jgi:hypothetical protein
VVELLVGPQQPVHVRANADPDGPDLKIEGFARAEVP